MTSNFLINIAIESKSSWINTWRSIPWEQVQESEIIDMCNYWFCSNITAQGFTNDKDQKTRKFKSSCVNIYPGPCIIKVNSDFEIQECLSLEYQELQKSDQLIKHLFLLYANGNINPIPDLNSQEQKIKQVKLATIERQIQNCKYREADWWPEVNDIRKWNFVVTAPKNNPILKF